MTNSATTLPFKKMHGLGNDFVVLNANEALNPELIRGLADRHRGIGFDQLAAVGEESPGRVSLTFYNADGSGSAACGNATRCIADWLMAKHGVAEMQVTVAGRGMLHAVRRPDGLVAVNMGAPVTHWAGIPLSEETDTLKLPLVGEPSATGMGNPHCTFFVDDAEAVDLARRGPEIEHHPLFPERTNVQFATVLSRTQIRMRVWERGTGVTLASGSSSCATAVAAARRGLTGRRVEIVLDGGTLDIDWRDDGVWMAGPTAHVFDGILTAEYLATL